mmetsp:Transcript_5158/g.10426  ORF Transcript_5158/g.10426 Transcript_5158/m.10426 type:complete len:222 (+) Transcript_5158:407-1072(+)
MRRHRCRLSRRSRGRCIPCLLIVLDLRSPWCWSSTSRTTSSLGGNTHSMWSTWSSPTTPTSPTSLYTRLYTPWPSPSTTTSSGRGHCIDWHRVHPSTPTSLHHGVTRSTLSTTASRLTTLGTRIATSRHHLWNHWVGWLHSRTLHVHGYSRVSHRLSHRRSSHHSWVRAVRMLCFKLSSSDFLALCQGDEDRLPIHELAVHFINGTSGLFRVGITYETETT